MCAYARDADEQTGEYIDFLSSFKCSLFKM